MNDYRMDKVPKPRSWYYSGITNMLMDRLHNSSSNNGDLVFVPGESFGGLGDRVTSLTHTKGGRLSILANFKPMAYIENTVFKGGIYGRQNEFVPKHPTKLIIGGLNLVARRFDRKLVFISWDIDYYLISVGRLGRFPDKSSNLSAMAKDTLHTLFNSNVNQQTVIQKSLYFHFKGLVNKLELEKSSKEYTLYHA